MKRHTLLGTILLVASQPASAATLSWTYVGHDGSVNEATLVESSTEQGVERTLSLSDFEEPIALHEDGIYWSTGVLSPDLQIHSKSKGLIQLHALYVEKGTGYEVQLARQELTEMYSERHEISIPPSKTCPPEADRALFIELGGGYTMPYCLVPKKN